MSVRKSAFWKLARHLKERIQLTIHQYKWLALNPHNETHAGNLFDARKVSVGRYTYGPISVLDADGGSKLYIGSFCSIAEGVTFILSGGHRPSRLTTFPLSTFVLDVKEPGASRGDIAIEDDVWIGHRAIVMDGVRVGRGAVVGAGSVVTRDVRPYSVVGGVPAREIGLRFREDLLDEVSRFDFDQMDTEFIRTHAASLLIDLEIDGLRALNDAHRESQRGEG